MRLHRSALAGCALAVVCGSVPAYGDSPGIGDEEEPDAWVLSANLGFGGELRDGNAVMSAHYLLFRTLGRYLMVGGRAGLFVEPGLGIGDSRRDASVLDVGILMGTRLAVGRIELTASAGPMLTLARPHSAASFEPAPDQRTTIGLGFDGGTSVRVVGPVGLGLYCSANVNQEVTVATLGLRADVAF